MGHTQFEQYMTIYTKYTKQTHQDGTMEKRKLTFWVGPWKRFDLEQEVECVQRRLAPANQGGHLHKPSFLKVQYF